MSSKNTSQVSMQETVRISQAKMLLKQDIIADKNSYMNLTTVLWGGIGVGKSSIAKRVFDELGYDVELITLSTISPLDMRGLPYSKSDSNDTWIAKIKSYIHSNDIDLETINVNSFFKTLLTAITTTDDVDIEMSQSKRFEYIPGYFFPTGYEDKPKALFFDEFNTAPPIIQVVCYMITLERKLGDRNLPVYEMLTVTDSNGVSKRFNILNTAKHYNTTIKGSSLKEHVLNLVEENNQDNVSELSKLLGINIKSFFFERVKTAVLMAGNRQEDGGATYELPAPLRGRLAHMVIETVAKDYITYWTSEECKGNINPFVLFYLAVHESDIYESPKDKMYGFANPRAWEMLSERLNSSPEMMSIIMGNNGNNKDRKMTTADESTLRLFVSRQLGISIAQKFVTFIKYQYQLPNISNLLKDYSLTDEKIEAILREYKILDATDMSLLYLYVANLAYSTHVCRKYAESVEEKKIVLKNSISLICALQKYKDKAEFMVLFITLISKQYNMTEWITTCRLQNPDFFKTVSDLLIKG